MSRTDDSDDAFWELVGPQTFPNTGMRECRRQIFLGTIGVVSGIVWTLTFMTVHPLIAVAGFAGAVTSGVELSRGVELRAAVTGCTLAGRLRNVLGVDP